MQKKSVFFSFRGLTDASLRLSRNAPDTSFYTASPDATDEEEGLRMGSRMAFKVHNKWLLPVTPSRV